MLHLLIPAAGASRRFKEAGICTPKGLIDIEWRGRRASMIEHVVESVGMPLPTHVGCAPDQTELFMRKLPYGIHTVAFSRGQADTVAQLAGTLDDTAELLVVNSDNAFDHAAPSHMVRAARAVQASSSALVFHARDSRYGFVDDYPFYQIGAEKVAISQWALAGAFYFKSAALFLDAYAEAVRCAGSGLDRERYISGLFEHIVGVQLAVGIRRSALHEWGTPQSLCADSTVIVHYDKGNVRVQ